MTNKNLKIFVSSSYEGRDKSIIKSILNIDDQYGYLTLKYIEDSSTCAVFLTKENDLYIAVLIDSKAKISIGPELNPKTVLCLFQHISESADIDMLEHHNYENSTLLEHVLKFLNSISDQLMEITASDTIENSENHFHILLNCNKSLVYSNVFLTPELQFDILNMDIKRFKINFISSNQDMKLNFSMSYQDFKWNIGLMSKEDVFHFDFKSEKKIIKQNIWPDYGHLPHQQEFLQLSSILNKHKLTYFELKKITCLKEELINAFLNANILLNYLVLESNTNANIISVKLNKNKFIRSLKSFFSFSGSLSSS